MGKYSHNFLVENELVIYVTYLTVTQPYNNKQ